MDWLNPAQLNTVNIANTIIVMALSHLAMNFALQFALPSCSISVSLTMFQSLSLIKCHFALDLPHDGTTATFLDSAIIKTHQAYQTAKFQTRPITC